MRAKTKIRGTSLGNETFRPCTNIIGSGTDRNAIIWLLTKPRSFNSTDTFSVRAISCFESPSKIQEKIRVSGTESEVVL